MLQWAAEPGRGMTREEILGHLRERLMGFAASHLSRDLAEDLAQEVLVVLEVKYAHLSRAEDLLPLSFQILRFKMAAARRLAVRHGEAGSVRAEEALLVDPGNDPEEAAERAELLERLRAALRKMEPRCRELFRLKLEGRSFPEIQGILGARSINTVYTWDARCRGRLLQAMGGRWEAQER